MAGPGPCRAICGHWLLSWGLSPFIPCLLPSIASLGLWRRVSFSVYSLIHFIWVSFFPRPFNKAEGAFDFFAAKRKNESMGWVERPGKEHASSAGPGASQPFLCTLRARRGTSAAIAGPWGGTRDTSGGRGNSSLLPRESRRSRGSERQGAIRVQASSCYLLKVAQVGESWRGEGGRQGERKRKGEWRESMSTTRVCEGTRAARQLTLS